MTKQSIRIGNAGGYWGDDPSALERQVEGGHLDYITMDFLAEITMSIMQKQKTRSPELGYARDFLPMLKSVLARTMASKTTIITNAGGINPVGCARAIAKMALELDLKPKVAVVHGDDIMPQIDSLQASGASFVNMESGQEFSEVKHNLQSANIYFGTAPVVEALKFDPDIIITGRVTDTGITVAPMIHEFGWELTDWNKIASGMVAGHILECGSQSTGGNFTDWQKVPSFKNIGFPIAEVYEDGSFSITKHENTGGLVTTETVREQLFYEMGNPKSYLTPDVVADFTTIKITQDGDNKVRISGVQGKEPTPFYKVSMAYGDGFKSQGSIAISGPNAREKAEAFAEIFWDRVGHMFSDKETEYFGWNACHKSLVGSDNGNEILLRLGVRSKDKDKLTIFGKMIPSLILAGPPGVSVTGGVPKPQEVVSYWPALIPKGLVHPSIGILSGSELSQERLVENTPIGQTKDEAPKESQVTPTATQPIKNINEFLNPSKPALIKIAIARSGDKGDTSNIGVIARTKSAYDFLDKFLTAELVKNLFQEICVGKVTRYSLPNMLGFNFLLEEALGGGGTKTLRIDAQGKTFAQAILSITTDIPPEVLADTSNPF